MLNPEPEEQWIDIKGYEDVYQISNFGRIRKLPSFIMTRGSVYISRKKIMKNVINDKNVVIVMIEYNSKAVTLNVKHLVVEYFIAGRKITKKEKFRIGYIDGNRYNLRADNLWIKTDDDYIQEKWDVLYKFLKPLYDEKGRIVTSKELAKYPKYYDILYTVLGSNLKRAARKFKFKSKRYKRNL
jgi:hypothetical protein